MQRLPIETNDQPSGMTKAGQSLTVVQCIPFVAMCSIYRSEAMAEVHTHRENDLIQGGKDI